MKATDINDISIMKTHCDWITEQAKELKALFNYKSEKMIKLNKARALSNIDTIAESINELKLYIENLWGGINHERHNQKYAE